jgi:hypothetical protein
MLGNGNIAVLDGGVAQLRFYDPKGQHIRTTGRKGSGPGEFRAPARIYRTHADTRLFFDGGTLMESTVDTAGVFVRAVRFEVEPNQPFKRDAWLWRRVFVDGPVRTSDRGAVAAALERLPAMEAADSFLFVKIDGFGRLWTRHEPHDPEHPSTWHVFGASGQPLGVIRTPPRFQIQDIGTNRLAGRGWDELGVEHVQVFAYDAPPPPQRSTLPVPDDLDLSPGPRPLRRDIAGMLRNATSQQEIFYSMNSRYAWRADQLQWPEDMKGFSAHITASGPRGYTMIIFNANDGGACGVASGTGGPVGWTPGVILCN